MPVRASVQPLPDPGHATLRLTDLDASPEGLTLSIERQQGPETHLGEEGWRRTEAWLAPERVRRSRNGLEFELGPASPPCGSGSRSPTLASSAPRSLPGRRC